MCQKLNRIGRWSSAVYASTALVSTLGAWPALAAQGEDGFSDEILVTATKSGETRLSETPIAISVYSDDYLSQMVASDIRDLTMSTPGLTISQNADFAQIYIRGVGSNNVFAGSDPSSTMHQDGVYLARPVAGFANFLDVERIEVLRGPQGTLYGRNSVGGTVNIVSKRPSLEKFTGIVQGTAGNSEFWRVDAYATGPVVEDKAAFSLAGQFSKRDPYRENIAPTGNDVDDEDVRSARGQFLWEISDSAEILVRGDYLRDDSTLYAGNTPLAPNSGTLSTSILGDYDKVSLNAPSLSDRELYGGSVEINVDLSANWSLKSLSAYRESVYAAAADPDATEIDVVRTLVDEEQDQISQEFNLIGDYQNLKAFFGLFYLEEDIDSTIEVQVRGSGISSILSPIVDTKTWAAFAQFQYFLTDRLSVTLGGRYTEETKDWDRSYGVYVTGTDTLVVDNTLPPETAKFDNFTPKFGLEFKPTDSAFLYATASKGFKSGGFNITGAVAGNYDPELLWAYEVGWKRRIETANIQTSLSAFYYDYTDLQVMAFIVPGTADITNAATAEVKGVEAEISAEPFEGLVIRASGAWLDAEYGSYPEAPVSGSAGTFDASGNKLNNAPEWSGSVLAEYTKEFPWGSTWLTGEFGYQSQVYFGTTNSALFGQEGYGVLNGSLGYETPNGRFSASLWARNIAAKDYIISAGAIVFPSGTAGSPRTYGVRVSASF